MDHRFFVLFLCVLQIIWGQPALTGYDYNSELGTLLTDGHVSSPGTFHLYYSVRSPLIFIGIVADTRDTTGWAGFGFSTTDLMIPGDAAIGMMDGVIPRLGDFYLSGRVASLNSVFCANGIAAVCYDPLEKPQGALNCSDNLSNTSVSRVGTFLVLQYARPIAASDFCDQAVNLTGPSNIIYAVGPTTTTFGWPFNLQYHAVRANTTFTFLATPPTSAATSMTTMTTMTSMTSMATTMTNQTTMPATSTSASTTGGIGTPPVLTGYSYDYDFSNNLTTGYHPAPLPQYYHMYYTFQPPTISIGIVAYSIDGWLGFGWSPSGFMQQPGAPSDAVLAYVDPIGNAFITDFTLMGRTAPDPVGCKGTSPGVCPDTSIATCADNINLKLLQRVGNYLQVEFSRPVIASDACDVAILPSGSPNQFVIYSLGPTINSMPWPFSVQYHTYHTNVTQAFNWIQNPAPPAGTTKPNGGNQLTISLLMVFGFVLLFLM